MAGGGAPDMLTLPAKARRKKQPYLSIRSRLVRRNLRRQAILFFSELRDYMARLGVDDAGPAFVRYLSIGSDGEMEGEFGYFTCRLHAGSGPIRPGVLPAGTFVTMVWTGPYERLPEVHAMLPGWARHSGIEFDATEAANGVAYACRMEIFHVTPRHIEDSEQFRTEIAILARSAADGVPERVVQPGEGSAPSFSHLPMGNWRNE